MSAKQAVLTWVAAVAVIALAGFAVWVSVADAPWEDVTPEVVEVVDKDGEIRCEGALNFRDAVVEAGRFVSGFTSFSGGGSREGNPSGLVDFDDQLEKAEREIARYC